MTNPKDIEKSGSGYYVIPVYSITENGLTDSGTTDLVFVKGTSNNLDGFTQSGITTESLLEAILDYLKEVNTGELGNRETSMAITKLDEAVLWLDKRRNDRQKRGVLATSQK